MVCQVESFVKPGGPKNLDSVWIDASADQVAAESRAVDCEAEEFVDPRARKFPDEVMLEDHHPPAVVGDFEEAVADDGGEVLAEAGFGQGDRGDAVGLIDEDGLFRKCFLRLGLGHTGIPRRPTEFRVVPGPGRCDGEVMPNTGRIDHLLADLG